MTYNAETIVSIDNIQPELKTLSIAIDHIIIDSTGAFISKIKRVRRGFLPGQIQEVHEYLDAEAHETSYQSILDVLQVIWTEEVIQNYQNLLAQADE